MIDGEIAGYSTAIGCAFMLAQGFPPEKVGEALRAGVVEVKKAMAELEKVDMAALMSLSPSWYWMPMDSQPNSSAMRTAAM